MAQNNLILTGIDFNQIKENLKTFLRNNSDFTDYNFEGSALTALVNLLAYNTQYNAYYLHMVSNDMFLDTAVMRSSIISHAKSLGYTPRSATGARCVIDIVLDVTSGSQPTTAILESTDRFETIIDGASYAFFPVTDYTATREAISGGYRYTFSDVELLQGTPTTTKFIFSGTDSQRFVLSNKNIDTSTVVVDVYQTPTSTSATRYTNASSVISLTSSDTVFFLQETSDGNIEIYFGDDIIGVGLSAGNVIVVNYKVVAGDIVNLSDNIQLTDSFVIDELDLDTTDINAGITLQDRIDGGAFSESLESIRIKAPKNYAGQERAVTEDDYKFFVEQVFPSVESVRVWGGQDNDPPYYGKVFLSIKPIGSNELTEFQKETIIDNIQKRNLISIIPVIVDPEYINLIIQSTVKFNSNLTTYNTTSLPTLIKTTISSYAANELNSFDSVLRFSKLLKTIDDTSSSINSNSTVIKLKKYIEPGATADYHELNYANAIIPGSLTSTEFNVIDTSISAEDNDNLFFGDDEAGVVHLYKVLSDGNTRKIKLNVGTINYTTGKVFISNIQFGTIFSGESIEVVVTPSEFDVYSNKNNILILDDSDISVTAEVEIN